MEGIFTLREKDVRDIRSLAQAAKSGDTLQIVVEGGGFVLLLNPTPTKTILKDTH